MDLGLPGWTKGGVGRRLIWIVAVQMRREPFQRTLGPFAKGPAEKQPRDGPMGFTFMWRVDSWMHQSHQHRHPLSPPHHHEDPLRGAVLTDVTNDMQKIARPYFESSQRKWLKSWTLGTSARPQFETCG